MPLVSAAQLAVLAGCKNAAAAAVAGASSLRRPGALRSSDSPRLRSLSGLVVPADKAGAFLLELGSAVTAGSLAAEKLPLAVQAAGLEQGVACAALTDVLWCVGSVARAAAKAWPRALQPALTPPGRLLSVRLEAAGEPRQRLLELARLCLEGGHVSRGALLENCEGEFLEELQLIRSAAAFKTKEVRVNTKVVYNQQKFNLLREESEGYAKVLTVLNNGGEAALSAATLPDVVRALQALIGFFDLDPNRVFDLVLDRCAAAPAAGGAGADDRLLHSSFRAAPSAAMWTRHTLISG